MFDIETIILRCGIWLKKKDAEVGFAVAGDLDDKASGRKICAKFPIGAYMYMHAHVNV